MQTVNIQTKPTNKALDKILWLLVILFVAALVWVNNYYVGQPIVRILSVTGLAILTIITCAFTRKGRFVIQFGKESRIELRKVVWPTRKETINTTLLVTVLTIIVGFCLWLIDILFMFIINLLTGAAF